MEREKNIYAKMLSKAERDVGLSNFPNTETCGLKAVFCIRGDNEDTYITNEIADEMGVDTEELLRIVNEDMKERYSIYDINEVCMSLIFGVDTTPTDLMQIDRCDTEDGIALYTIMFPDKKNGATILLSSDILNDIYKRTNGAYYLIPSSIDELLLVPSEKSEKKTELVQSWLRDVNSKPDCVPRDLYLSDDVLFYDGKELATV